jgi:hypothetical protein|tara:strand:- start:6848 stop:7219 length:372 start_codon:yes stop_codon:yes gene_type:complete
VKRNDDFIRGLLFDFEGSDNWRFQMEGTSGEPSEEEWRTRYHTLLMMDEGLLTLVGNTSFRLTSAGHNYLEAVRDEGIWTKTKEAVAATGGSASFEIIKSVAMALIETKLEKHTGLKLSSFVY